MTDDTRIKLADDVKAETDGDAVHSETDDLVGTLTNEQPAEGDELGLYEDWMPGAEQYQGKTHIAQHQAHALAAVRQLPKVYEMLGIYVDGFDQFIQGLVENYEQYATSIEGESREQQMRVLMAKAGVHADIEEGQRAMWSRLLSNEPVDDE